MKNKKKDTKYLMTDDGYFFVHCAPCQPNNDDFESVDEDDGSMSNGLDESNGSNGRNKLDDESGEEGLGVDVVDVVDDDDNSEIITLNVVQERLLSEINKIIATHKGSTDATMKLVKQRLLQSARNITVTPPPSPQNTDGTSTEPMTLSRMSEEAEKLLDNLNCIVVTL